MDEKQSIKLLEAIKNGRCILILGPAASKIEDKPIIQLFSKYLSEELDLEDISYDKTQIHNLQYIIQKYLNIKNVVSTDPADEAHTFFINDTLAKFLLP